MPILGIWASQGRVASTAYESIATTTVGAGGQSTVTFSSIPSTYTHLQIRGISRGTSGSYDQIYMRFNSDTGNNYAAHAMYGDGTSAAAFGSSSVNQFSIAANTGSTQPANTFGTMIIDILDYASTAKFKTTRAISGANGNTTQGYIWFASGLWQSTNAITSISFQRLVSGSNNPFDQYSHFALYGIRGA